MNRAGAIRLFLMTVVGFLLLDAAVNGKLGSMLGALIDPTNMNEWTTNSHGDKVNVGASSTFGKTYSSGSYQALAASDATKYGINPDTFVRQIQQESGFNPNALSSAGAIGIAQFLAPTAAAMGVNPRDPKSALDGAARLDAQNLAIYNGDYQKMLAAYNAGNGAVNGAVAQWGVNWLAHMPLQTRNYVSTILGSGTGATSLQGGAF